MKKTIGKETTELTTEYGTDDYKFMHDMFIENSYLTLNRDGVYDLDYQVIEEKIFQIGCNKLGAQFILRKKKVEEKSEYQHEGDINGKPPFYYVGFYDSAIKNPYCPPKDGSPNNGYYNEGFNTGRKFDEWNNKTAYSMGEKVPCKQVKESYSFLRGFYDAITTGKCCTFNSEAGTQAHNDYIRGYRFGAGRDE